MFKNMPMNVHSINIRKTSDTEKFQQKIIW